MKLIVLIAGVIIFSLENFVIFNLFSGLPGSLSGHWFYITASFALTIIHLIILTIFVFMIIKRFKARYIVIMGLSYLIAITLFFLSCWAYNIKEIESKAQKQDSEMIYQDSIKTTIAGNLKAIKKYNEIIENTNSIKVITDWRKVVNELTASNAILHSEESKNTNVIQDNDPFQLIALRTGMSRSLLLFWLLSAMWFLFELGLWLCIIIEVNLLLGNNIFGNIVKAVPGPAVKPAEDPIKYSEDWREFIIEFESEIYKYIDALFNKSTPKRLNNNDEIMAATGLSRWHVNKMRPLLSRGIRVGDKFLVDGTQGKYQGNFKPEQMKDVVKKIATGEGKPGGRG